MADIYFYQGDTDEDEGGYSDSSITTPSQVTKSVMKVVTCITTVLQDDGLSPVEKLEKYADSENIFNRQMVARTVLETLRQVLEERGPAHGDREEVGAEVGRVFRVVELLARDTEPSVRAELMEQVILQLSSLFSNLNLRNIVFQHISPATGSPHSDVLPGAGDPAAALLADGGGAHAPPAPGRQVSRHREDALLDTV